MPDQTALETAQGAAAAALAQLVDGSAGTMIPTGHYPEELAEIVLTAAAPILLAEAEQLRYERRLLGFARYTLDGIAERGQEWSDIVRRDAADIAQRIVDEIGHPVTDEPALGPHYREQIEQLRADADAGEQRGREQAAREVLAMPVGDDDLVSRRAAAEAALGTSAAPGWSWAEGPWCGVHTGICSNRCGLPPNHGGPHDCQWMQGEPLPAGYVAPAVAPADVGADDESAAEVAAAFEAGEKGVTARPLPRGQTAYLEFTPTPAGGEARCPSCEHTVAFHSEGGCWYAVAVGTPNRDMVCQCSVRESSEMPASPSEGPASEITPEEFAQFDADIESCRGRESDAAMDGAAHSVWLHGKWQWLTQQMTTPEREAFAAAVARFSATLDPDEPVALDDLRWWRDAAGRTRAPLPPGPIEMHESDCPESSVCENGECECWCHDEPAPAPPAEGRLPCCNHVASWHRGNYCLGDLGHCECDEKPEGWSAPTSGNGEADGV